jgi:mono/diheme cytochrome c family protein
LIFGCNDIDTSVKPVDLVINSMSDSLPKIILPEDADPQDENWKGIDLEPKPPVLPLYPEEEATKFLLPKGYHIAPILTEPQIEQPGAISFDGNGRMYVLELRTYMLSADSDGTLDPISRISRWEDKDNDGIYETGTVFVDSLIFPRFVLPYGKDCILSMESDTDNVYKYTDTNGDGKADKKEFFTNKYGRSGNVEHQQAFMYYGMDNWLYSTVNAFRVRETPSGVIREKTGYNRAQWGVTHDDNGKLWFQGGASGVPSHFQFPIHYGNYTVENNLAEGFEIPWGAPIKIADMQGGMDQIRGTDGSLNKVTGSAGNDVYRGDRLPAELYGQYFYGEPVARIVRQINPVVSEGLTTLHNVYQEEQSEFLRSTDPLFRPVDMTTAPDGTLYITDMYHGIIQEGQWAQKGTYLRTKIEQYQLDKVIGLGRIWRITHDSRERDTTKPNMFDKKPSDLISHLEHPNGWWRDKAQQLIVLSRDQSTVPELRKMALSNTNPLARIHAIWCLEGLGALQADVVKKLFQDPNPKIRTQAMRASETLYKSGNTQLASSYLKLLEDENVDVALQAMLTSKFLEVPNYKEVLAQVLKNNPAKGIQTVGTQILKSAEVEKRWNGNDVLLSNAQQESLVQGKIIFNELCVQCHGNDGTGTPLGNGTVMAPPLSGSVRVQEHPEYIIKAILHGLEGPLNGKTYPAGIMVGNKEQSDDWIASVASYIRTNLSNEASLVTSDYVTEVRSKTVDKQGTYKFPELIGSVPTFLPLQEDWLVTASHTAPNRIGGTASPKSAFNFEGWTTGENQTKGMWFQIEFPTALALTSLQLNAPPISRGWREGSPPPLQTYPRSYEILVSKDGKNWTTLDKGEGTDQDFKLDFAPVLTKYLKLTLNGTVEEENEIPWRIRQLKLYVLKPRSALSK